MTRLLLVLGLIALVPFVSAQNFNWVQGMNDPRGFRTHRTPSLQYTPGNWDLPTAIYPNGWDGNRGGVIQQPVVVQRPVVQQPVVQQPVQRVVQQPVQQQTGYVYQRQDNVDGRLGVYGPRIVSQGFYAGSRRVAEQPVQQQPIVRVQQQPVYQAPVQQPVYYQQPVVQQPVVQVQQPVVQNTGYVMQRQRNDKVDGTLGIYGPSYGSRGISVGSGVQTQVVTSG